jgi:hypothetical protein
MPFKGMQKPNVSASCGEFWQEKTALEKITVRE